jgi:hypothetical protein
MAAFNKQEAARKAEKLRLQQEAADLKAKEAKLLKDKAEKEAQLAAAKAKLDADKAAKAKAEADAKAAAALKTARDAQVAADAAAYAAASPSGKSVVQTQIAADTKKASDAGKAVVTAQNAAADAKKALDDGKQIIGKLTLDIPRILPRLIGIREQFQNDLNQVQAASPYVNGIDAKFYKLSTPPNKMPAFQALTPAFSNNLKTEINFRNADDFGKYGFTTRFALTLNGFIDIPYEGQWLFFIESDDGSKLFIDGNLVIENDGLHGMVEKSSSVRLTKGKHVLRVEFSQWDWGGGLILRWWGTRNKPSTTQHCCLRGRPRSFRRSRSVSPSTPQMLPLPNWLKTRLLQPLPKLPPPRRLPTKWLLMSRRRRTRRYKTASLLTARELTSLRRLKPLLQSSWLSRKLPRSWRTLVPNRRVCNRLLPLHRLRSTARLQIMPPTLALSLQASL